MAKTLKFKTNIKCMGCVSQVTAALNDAVGIDKWEVDLLSPDKVLTISSELTDADIVVNAVEEVGFKAEPVR